MKKIIAISTIVLLIILVGIVNVQAASATVDLELNKTTVEPGDSFTVTVAVTSADGINAVTGIAYSYDTDKLDLISANVGTNFSILSSENKIDLICNSTEKITTANVYVLEFKAKSDITTQTTANISFESMIVDSDAATDSESTIEAKSVPVTITPKASENQDNTNTAGNTTDEENTSANTNENKNANDATNDINTINTIIVTNTTTVNNIKTKDSEQKLPYTGTQQIIFGIILVLTGIAGITYTLYKKYKNI